MSAAGSISDRKVTTSCMHERWNSSHKLQVCKLFRSWLTNRRCVLLMWFLLSLPLLLLKVLTQQQCYFRFHHHCTAAAAGEARQSRPHKDYLQDNRTIVEYKPELAARVIRLNRRRASADDPEVVELAGDVIDLPSTSSEWRSKNSDISYATPQALVVDRYLRHKKNGFFVECGAFDGHHSSNTLWLETVRNWTGLLIEMDPFLYTQLRSLRRQAYSVNACLSPVASVSMIRYKTMARCNQCGRLMVEDYESGNATPRSSDTGISTNKSNDVIQNPTALCLPIESLMLALNRTQIDYFSLDVEGLELDILKTIPWNLFNIQMISVEYDKLRRGSKRHLVDFMRARGYGVVYDIHYVNDTSQTYVDDYVFVKHD